MNINFHYYLVKAMAIEAGLSEDEAQIVALTSQMVDDVTPNCFFTCLPIPSLMMVSVALWDGKTRQRSSIFTRRDFRKEDGKGSNIFQTVLEVLQPVDTGS